MKSKNYMSHVVFFINKLEKSGKMPAASLEMKLNEKITSDQTLAMYALLSGSNNQLEVPYAL